MEGEDLGIEPRRIFPTLGLKIFLVKNIMSLGTTLNIMKSVNILKKNPLNCIHQMGKLCVSQSY